MWMEPEHTLNKIQTHNLEARKQARQDLNLSLSAFTGKGGGKQEMGWHSLLQCTRNSGSHHLRLHAKGLGLCRGSSPVGIVAHGVQNPGLVQISWEAMQHPPFLDAILLLQTLGQNLGDDTIWNCKGRQIREHPVDF